MEQRLQKILSSAGITSRRKAEALILEGRVRVNGRVVKALGTRADPERDHIVVDGQQVSVSVPKAYLILYKPRGYVTTLFDPLGRRTVGQLLAGIRQRVYPVGRLDYDTEGVLLFTNDGDLAHTLMHPRHGIPKTYQVKVKGILTDEDISRLERGIRLEEGRTAPCRIRKLKKSERNSWLEVTLHEGKKRQIRRMFERAGHFVLKLKRTRYAFLTLAGLLPG